MGFTRKTEIKDISPTDLRKIAKVLNQSFAWKKLMQTVPNALIDAELLNEGEKKYNLHHIKLIETASLKANSDKSAAQLFLEEWMTTGRIRPTLSHLLQLLIKCELFRAADYVAEDFLSEEAPQRPSKGPAARVDIDLPHEDDDINVPERLSDINSPTEIRNFNNPIQSKQIHEKEISPFDTSTTETDFIRKISSFNKTASVTVPVHLNNNIASHQQSSTTNGAAQRPEENQCYHQSQPSASIPGTHNMPNFSLLNLQFNNLSNSDSIDHAENIAAPNLSILNLRDGADSHYLSNSNVQDLNVPNLPILHDGVDSHSSIGQQGYSEIIPQFSTLMNHSQSLSDRQE